MNRSPHPWDLLFINIFVKSIIFERLSISHTRARRFPHLGGCPSVAFPHSGALSWKVRPTLAGRWPVTCYGAVQCSAVRHEAVSASLVEQVADITK